MNQSLAIIVPTINPRVLADFIESLKKQKNRNFHVFVIDISGSTSSKIAGDNITCLKRENKGYAHSVNEGLREALQKEFSRFCIINDDTFFEQDFVERSLSSIEKHPGVIVGGKILYAPGHEYHKDRYPQADLGKVIWYAGGFFDWDHALSKHRGVDEVDHGQYNTSVETEFITGALMLLDKSVIGKVGFWDESYFLYFEDADYCVRASKKDVSLYYDPAIIIWHKISQSTGGSGSSLHAKYQNKNRLKFGLTYAPVNTKLHLLKNFVFSFGKR